MINAAGWPPAHEWHASGIAAALLREWSRVLAESDQEPAFVGVPRLLTVTTGDVGRAYGDYQADASRATRVQLRLDPAEQFDDQTFLTIVVPHDFAASAGEYLAQVCADLSTARTG